MQSRRMSIIETLSDTLSAGAFGVLVNKYMMPAFGFEVDWGVATTYTLIFMALSMWRKYLWRRLFVWMERRGVN